MGFPIWTVIYRRDGERDFGGIGTGIYTGFTLLGGEPFEPENQVELVHLLRKVRETYPEKDIWCYSGYLWDRDLAAGGVVHTEVTDEMLSYVDVLVDGEFVEAEKDLTLQFRGSRNQRILELKRIGRNNKNEIKAAADRKNFLICGSFCITREIQQAYTCLCNPGQAIISGYFLQGA